MTINEWKKLTPKEREALMFQWDIKKNEGKALAEAVLEDLKKAFSKNKKVKIFDGVDPAQGGSEWTFCAQFFSDKDLDLLPSSYLGFEVRRYFLDKNKKHPLQLILREIKKKKHRSFPHD